jgi:2'-5' RNA ligase
MRVFLAIDLPEEARVAVVARARRVARAADRAARDIRWVRPEHLHLTLLFLGEVDPTRAAALGEAMLEPFDEPAFRLSLGDLGAFPARGAPHVLWLGLDEGARSVERLHQAATDRAGRLGLSGDAARFHPHLTIGRWKRARPSDREAVVSSDSGPHGPAFQVDAVALFDSRLGPEGPTHTILARAPLAPAPTG